MMTKEQAQKEIAWCEEQLTARVELMRTAADRGVNRISIIASAVEGMNNMPREKAILLLAVAAMLLAESERKEKEFAG